MVRRTTAPRPPTPLSVLTVTSGASEISRLEAMDQAPSRSKFKTSGDGSTAAGKGSRDVVHPFENSKDLLVVLANDAIDVEEEARLYDELRAATQSVSPDPSDPSPVNIPITSRHLSKFSICPTAI